MTWVGGDEQRMAIIQDVASRVKHLDKVVNCMARATVTAASAVGDIEFAAGLKATLAIGLKGVSMTQQASQATLRTMFRPRSVEAGAARLAAADATAYVAQSRKMAAATASNWASGIPQNAGWSLVEGEFNWRDFMPLSGTWNSLLATQKACK